MSDALNYLVKARPEAMSQYFGFLKECGKHLDPKTRNLISVITKVDAQTERGFRQYLGRALREGPGRLEEHGAADVGRRRLREDAPVLVADHAPGDAGDPVDVAQQILHVFLPSADPALTPAR